MNRVSQNQKILEYLKTHDYISPLDALNEFGCLRLASRVCDLKKQGYDIKTEIFYGKDKRFAKYRLGEIDL